MMEIHIYQRVLPHYRLGFFDELYIDLLKRNIQLKVFVGYERRGEVPKTVRIDRPWVQYRKNIYLRFFGLEAVFQMLNLSSLARKRYVIVEQSNRLLVNYVFMLLSKLSWSNLSFWGHGFNHQSNSPNGLRERLKRHFLHSVNWWFAYTEGTKEYLLKNGFNENCITVVNNSIDSKSLRTEYLNFLQSEELSKRYRKGIFCGGVYFEKKIPFLLDSILIIKESIPDFYFTFIGSGPEDYLLEDFCRDKDWCEYVGHVSGTVRAEYFVDADVFLMPGLVGLAVLDSFVLETPMVTTDSGFHSPEIEYLIHGYNGIVTDCSVELYADAIVTLLKDQCRLDELKKGCRESSEKYSMESMVGNFSDGINKWIIDR